MTTPKRWLSTPLASVTVLAFAGLLSAAPAGRAVDIYFMDVESGSATLIVLPSGRAVLIDGGNKGARNRDAQRFLALAKQTGIKKLDYLIVTHYHSDHYGDTPEISRNFPIVNWVDHGPNVEHDKDVAWQQHWVIKCDEALYAEYLRAQKDGKHIVASPGDKIPVDELNIQIVSSAGKLITSPLPGGGQPNSACAATPIRSDDETEDGQSVGMLITFGKFRYTFLGDLTWNKSRQLFCPNNLVGPVDVYETTHHGLSVGRENNEVRWGRSCCSEAEVFGLRPRVAILNAGEEYHKQAGPRAWQVIHSLPGLQDFWQLHYEVDGGKDNNVPEQYIANLSAAKCEGHWIKLSAEKSGAFTVTNSRNGLTKQYPPTN